MKPGAGEVDFLFVNRHQAGWERGHDRRAVACHVQRYLERVKVPEQSADACCSDANPNGKEGVNASDENGITTDPDSRTDRVICTDQRKNGKQQAYYRRLSLKGTKRSSPMKEQHPKPIYTKSRKPRRKKGLTTDATKQPTSRDMSVESVCIKTDNNSADDVPAYITSDPCTAVQSPRDLLYMIPLSMDESIRSLVPIVQRGFTFQSLDRMTPDCTPHWVSAQVFDITSAHSFCAFALAFASRSAASEMHRQKLSHMALLHYKKSVSLIRSSIQRIRGRQDLMCLLLATVNTALYAYVTGDFPTLLIHIDGLGKIIDLIGALNYLDISIQLVILVGVGQQTSQTLAKPLFNLSCWEHLLDVQLLMWAREIYGLWGDYCMFPTTVVFRNKDTINLFLEMKLFHGLLFKFHHNNQSAADNQTLQFQIDLQFHHLKLRLVNAYHDLVEDDILATIKSNQSSYFSHIQALRRAFIVALLCYHNVLYYHASHYLGLSKGYFIPFHHLRPHLTLAIAEDEVLLQFPIEAIAMLLWITFVGAHEEANEDQSRPERLDWYKRLFARLLHQHGNSASGASYIQDVLGLFLYNNETSEPVLRYLTCPPPQSDANDG